MRNVTSYKSILDKYSSFYFTDLKTLNKRLLVRNHVLNILLSLNKETFFETKYDKINTNLIMELKRLFDNKNLNMVLLKDILVYMFDYTFIIIRDKTKIVIDYNQNGLVFMTIQDNKENINKLFKDFLNEVNGLFNSEPIIDFELSYLLYLSKENNDKLLYLTVVYYLDKNEFFISSKVNKKNIKSHVFNESLFNEIYQALKGCWYVTDFNDSLIKYLNNLQHFKYKKTYRRTIIDLLPLDKNEEYNKNENDYYSFSKNSYYNDTSIKFVYKYTEDNTFVIYLVVGGVVKTLYKESIKITKSNVNKLLRECSTLVNNLIVI